MDKNYLAPDASEQLILRIWYRPNTVQKYSPVAIKNKYFSIQSCKQRQTDVDSYYFFYLNAHTINETANCNQFTLPYCRVCRSSHNGVQIKKSLFTTQKAVKRVQKKQHNTTDTSNSVALDCSQSAIFESVFMWAWLFCDFQALKPVSYTHLTLPTKA